MKKISAILLASTLIIMTLSSCRKVSGSGPIVTESRGLSGFTQIKSEFSGDVQITSGDNYSVSIEAQKNIINSIETVLSNGMLTLRVKNNTIVRPDERIKIYITSPDIRGLIVSGSGNIQLLNHLPTSDLYLKVGGSGNISIPGLSANSVDATISGSGTMTILDGSVTEEIIEISGSGSVDFTNLMATRSNIKITGSGNANVYVTESMKVKITGSGSVYYKGTPSIDVSITGSGKLKQL